MFRQRLSCDRAAISAGGQLVLQPAFATSDRKFNTQEIVSSAAIAADCSGNERAMKRCKMSGYLKRGLHAMCCRCSVGMAISTQLYVQTGVLAL